MATQTDSLSVYRELADRYDQLGQFSMRDRFLMLAAAAALEGGQEAEAERLRVRLLQQNRHHMLRPYRSFEEAAAAPDVQTYLGDLKANYPPELAAQLLASLQEGKAPPVTNPKPLTARKPSVAPAPKPHDAVPMTAPIVEPYGLAEPLPPKVAWEPVAPRKVVSEVEMTRPIPPSDIPATIPPAKPLAQPIPFRPKPLSETNRPVARPTVPVARPRARPMPEPGPVPEPTPAAPPRREVHGGAWLCVLLMGVAAVAGVALGGFTLARPFLPREWLP